MVATCRGNILFSAECFVEAEDFTVFLLVVLLHFLEKDPRPLLELNTEVVFHGFEDGFGLCLSVLELY